MTDSTQPGSSANYPSQGVSTIIVVGWPGVATMRTNPNPHVSDIIATTDNPAQTLEFSTRGLGGIVQLHAFQEADPGATPELTLWVPQGTSIDVQQRSGR